MASRALRRVAATIVRITRAMVTVRPSAIMIHSAVPASAVSKAAAAPVENGGMMGRATRMLRNLSIVQALPKRYRLLFPARCISADARDNLRYRRKRLR